ncbi:MAG: hypothetical protein HY922_08280 [Elusimicrobia bacterium]|nr:hypothetical protein [Elusimicrobiota bacterium]
MLAGFSEQERAVVNGFIEAGIALSSEKLSRLSNTRWDIVYSSVEELPVIKVLSMFREDRTQYRGVHLRSRSLLPLEILLLFSEAGARDVTEAVIQATGGALRKLADPQTAVISEVGNIMGQGVLRAVANGLKISLILTSPRLLKGSKSEVIGQSLDSFDGSKNAVILLRIDMSSAKLASECSMALVMDVALMRRLLQNAQLV